MQIWNRPTTAARELPYPRVTAFLHQDDGFQQVERVQASRVWPLDARGEDEPSFLCLRRNYGERLAAFNARGEMLWEHDPGSCADTQNIQVCPETNTVYAFGYSHVSPLDLKTGERKGYGDMPNSSRCVFSNQDGHLIMLAERQVWVRDENMRTLSKKKYPFAHSRADHDERSRLITLQGENYKKDGEFRHYVVSESGKLLFDEPKLTVHPGLSDGEGRLLQVIADPQTQAFEVLRLSERGGVERFPVDEGVVAALPMRDGSFATLNLGAESGARIELRDAQGHTQASAELPTGLAGISATADGVLLTFCQEDKSTRVLAFNGALQEVYSGPDLALTAALPDGGIVVVRKEGVEHHSPEGTREFSDPWKAAEALGPLASYHLPLPIVHLRGREGWTDLWRDAQDVLGYRAPADVPVRVAGGALEIVKNVSEDEVRSRLGLSPGEWHNWNSAPTPAALRQHQEGVIAKKVLHDEVDLGGLDPETWRSATVYAGYRETPTAVADGKAGRDKLLCLGTSNGQVGLFNLSPQGAQTRDRLPATVVRTELQSKGMLALDEQGNFMLIEPQTWKGGELEPGAAFNPKAVPPNPNSQSLAITDQSVQIGAVRVKRR